MTWSAIRVERSETGRMAWSAIRVERSETGRMAVGARVAPPRP